MTTENEQQARALNRVTKRARYGSRMVKTYLKRGAATMDPVTLAESLRLFSATMKRLLR